MKKKSATSGVRRPLSPSVVIDSRFAWTPSEEDTAAWKVKSDAMTPEQRKEYVMDDSVTKMYPDKIDVSGIELVDKEDQGGKAPEQ